MAKSIKLTLVGAGSSYTPELVAGILASDEAELPVSSLRLHDIDASRLETMAGLSARMIQASGRQIALSSGTALEPLLEGADFVVSQIRVGGQKARQLDESIPLKYGLIGQETTGPGGMMKALRTIPQALAMAETVARVAPQAFILNYTNPSGIIAEAVSRHSKAKIIGLCSGIPSIQADLKRRMEPEFPGFESFCVGTNHFGFIHRMTSQGRDVTQQVIGRLKGEKGFELAGLLGAVPIGYVNYFFHRKGMLEHMQASPLTRGGQVEAIEREIFAEAGDPTVHAKPKALERRGGGGYSDVTFAAMKAIFHDRREKLTANVPSLGAVDGIDAEAVMELVCELGAAGAKPLPVGKIPQAFRGAVMAVKDYESLTVQAAVAKDRRLAVQALMNHPLVGDLDLIEPMLDELMAAHGMAWGKA